jgi:hypothetical protein
MSPTKTVTAKKEKAFSAEERAAMKERAKEVKAAAEKEGGEAAAMEKYDEMAEPERSMGKRLHEIIKANAPDLSVKTWYGQPAYATKDGKIVCFFQSAQKFNTRYATLGFNESAKLDDGTFWPVAFALKELTPDVEKKIAALVKKAVR